VTSNGEAELNLTERTTLAIGEVLAGRRAGVRAKLLFAGPAIIASIAYMDPGNFATNLQAGFRYGHALLRIVLAANIIAMLFQALSAKLGIVTNRNLAEICREQFPTPLVYEMWRISEIAALATDLAEFLGGAIGLSLLFDLQLLAGMLVTGILTYAIFSVWARFSMTPPYFPDNHFGMQRVRLQGTRSRPVRPRLAGRIDDRAWWSHDDVGLQRRKALCRARTDGLRRNRGRGSSFGPARLVSSRA